MGLNVDLQCSNSNAVIERLLSVDVSGENGTFSWAVTVISVSIVQDILLGLDTFDGDGLLLPLHSKYLEIFPVFRCTILKILSFYRFSFLFKASTIRR